MPRAAETGPEKRRGEVKARAAAKRAGTTKMRKKHKNMWDEKPDRLAGNGRRSRN